MIDGNLCAQGKFTGLEDAVKLLCALLVAAAPLAAQQSPTTPVPVLPERLGAVPPVDRWEKNISAFDAADRLSPFPKGGIVFVGSSTIRRWDVATYFPDLKILNRGFGGSTMGDVARFVDRIVIPYEPRLVVVYSGDNDIGSGQTSEQVIVQVERFVRAVHAKLPQTRIVFLGIKPSV